MEQGPGRALKFMPIPVASDMTLLTSKFFANIILLVKGLGGIILGLYGS